MPETEAVPPASGTGRLPGLDEIEALIDDVLTYVDAEVMLQKTRANFLADSVKRIAVFGVVALFLAILAAIGLTVGLIFALTPLVTAWGAIAIVVGVLLLGAFLLVRAAANIWSRATRALRTDDPSPEHSANG